MSRKTIEPRDIVAIIDTREQAPLDLSPLRTEKGTLTTGDYSIKGLESEIAIERKSLPDLHYVQQCQEMSIWYHHFCVREPLYNLLPLA